MRTTLAGLRTALVHTDMARAWWQRGNRPQTAAALMEAIRTSSGEVRDRSAIRRVVTDLLQLHPLVPGVRKLGALTG
jgi:hypothetical protein